MKIVVIVDRKYYMEWYLTATRDFRMMSEKYSSRVNSKENHYSLFQFYNILFFSFWAYMSHAVFHDFHDIFISRALLGSKYINDH